MSDDFIPRKDELALIYCTTLANAMAAEPQRFGLGAEDVAALQAQVAEFGASLQNVDKLTAARAAEIERKRARRSSVEETVRGLVRRVHANPNVDDSVKAGAGIPARDRVRSHLSPLVPTELRVSTDARGTHHLAWKAADPGRGTRYVIEARVGAAPDFVMVANVAAHRYKHRGQKLGEPILYRVRAQRSGRTSDPSGESGVYLNP